MNHEFLDISFSSIPASRSACMFLMKKLTPLALETSKAKVMQNLHSNALKLAIMKKELVVSKVMKLLNGLKTTV